MGSGPHLPRHFLFFPVVLLFVLVFFLLLLFLLLPVTQTKGEDTAGFRILRDPGNVIVTSVRFEMVKDSNMVIWNCIWGGPPATPVANWMRVQSTLSWWMAKENEKAPRGAE